MAYTLSKEDKTAIIDQHMKSLATSKYNMEVSLLIENAVENPSETNVDYYNGQIETIDAKIDALTAELNSL